MTMTNATNEQLELGFNGVRLCVKATGRGGRIPRAGWWFDQMRSLVGRAVESNTRPEQIWLAGATREVQV